MQFFARAFGHTWWLCVFHRCAHGFRVTQLQRDSASWYTRKTYFRFVS